MLTDLDKLAAEAEADRLSGVYVRVMMLAQAQRIDLIEAGREAVAKGLVSAGDWQMLCEAMGRQQGRSLRRTLLASPAAT